MENSFISICQINSESKEMRQKSKLSVILIQLVYNITLAQLPALILNNQSCRQ